MLLMAISIQLSAQRVITGRILNLNSRLPVEGVAVTIFKGTETTVTNRHGHFQLTVNENDTLIFTHPDYQTGSLSIPAADVFVVYMVQYRYFPTYLKGEVELFAYLQKNLKYPRKARFKGIEGLLFIEVMIDSTGAISKCSALNEVGADCEAEIVEVFRKIPGGWSSFDIPVQKRLIFPVELKAGVDSRDLGDEEISLPDGKLMNKITIAAYQVIKIDR
jgi:hypothetical protein